MEDVLRTALTNALSASILATAVAAVGLVLSRRPAVLHCLWLIVLVKLMTPPLLDVPLAAPQALEAPFDSEAGDPLIVHLDEAEPSLDVDATVFLDGSAEADALTDFSADQTAEEPAPWIDSTTFWAALGSVWLVGSIVAAGLAAIRVRRFQRVLRNADPAEPEIEEEIAELAHAMGLHRAPGVVFVEGRLTPMLWAVGRPRLVIPRDLWKSLDDDRRRMLATHELAHLRRGDHWVRFLELAATVAFWWLPVVWWVRRALRDVEEQCCDAWVVWMFPDHARSYAETLLDTVDFLNPVAKPEPLLASGFGKVQHLRKRLTMVMLGTTPRTLGWSGTLGALALAVILLPMSPSWAQKADDPKATTIENVSTTAATEYNEDSFTATTSAGDDLIKMPSEVVFVRLDDSKPDGEIATEEIRFVVDDPDSKEKRAEAVQKAIDTLIARIEELDGKAKDGESDDAKKRRANQIERLKSTIERLEKLDGKASNLKARRRIVVNHNGDVLTDNIEGPSITFEGKPLDVKVETEDVATTTTKEFVVAGKDGKLGSDVVKFNPKRDSKEIKAALERVGVLHRELAAKQKELDEANRKLNELQGYTFTVGRPGAVTLREVRVPRVDPTAPVRELRTLRLERNDGARLDSLEKKLSKVLDELESLKKSREGQGEKK